MTAMEARRSRVMVKLQPGAHQAPDEVLFNTKERAALAKAAAFSGYTRLSTFVRELCVAAAEASVVRKARGTDRAVLLEAAGQCGLPLGAWMRETTLAGIAYQEPIKATPLEDQKTRARRWVVDCIGKVMDVQDRARA